MRTFAMIFICGVSLVAGRPALAGTDGSVFADKDAVQLAHEKRTGHDHDSDERLTREELRERKRELREQERELREQERARIARKPIPPRFWVGVGTGVGYATVDVPCSFGSSSIFSDCSEEGQFHSYSANVTLAGRHAAFRVRGIRDQDKGNDSRTAYEQAVLIGTRFGRSNWYGMGGYGRIRHVDDDFLKDRAEGFAWEILFEPSSEGPLGLELSFQGNSGKDVDFVGFNLGFRLGALR